jgi:putative nucleotidyltransferase with HDIG domain
MPMPLSGVAPTQIAPRTERWLPHAIVATAFVVLLPALAVWMLVPRGNLTLIALSVPVGVLLSVIAAAVGTALWKRVPGSRDLVFADLMLWGWLRRLRAERRLRHAESLLGTHAEGLSVQALTDLSVLLEARDTFTYGHSLRVTRHAERIAAELGLPADEVARVRTAAALHDVGKLHTPRAILNKPGRLTDEEFAVIRRHPGDGADLAGSVGDPAITRMIRHHHERLDGAGYPDGLSGAAIPLGARIIAVADTFDAMTSNRAYRRASSHKRALDVLRQEAGKQLDADAVAAFVGYYRGRRTVVWSAFAAAAPQRLFAWLGGVSPGVGVAGAAAVAIGVASPQAPVVSPAAAAPRPAVKRAAAATATPAFVRPVPGDGPTASVQRFTRRSSGTRSRPPRAQRQKRHRPAGPRHKTTKPRKVKPRAAAPPRRGTPRASTPQNAAPPKPKPAQPVKVKPQAAKPAPARPAPAKPAPAKPQPQAKPDKLKPPPAPAPAPKPPTVKPPKVTLPGPLPQPAPADKVKKPKA